MLVLTDTFVSCFGFILACFFCSKLLNQVPCNLDQSLPLVYNVICRSSPEEEKDDEAVRKVFGDSDEDEAEYGAQTEQYQDSHVS